MEERKDGLYDQLITNLINDEISDFDLVKREVVENEKLQSYLVQLLSRSISNALGETPSDSEKIALANKILETVDSPERLIDVSKAERLIALVRQATSDRKWVSQPPSTPLSQLGLITNSNHKLNMSSELKLEMRSSNSVDILMSFVKKKGIAILADELGKLRERGVQVRLLTTVYTGATDKAAIDLLSRDLGVEVRINYNADQSHLHAKAWLFKRDTGFSTAYVGSSNISGPALTDGLEWNVRLSQVASPGILDQFQQAFNSYWVSSIFEAYDPDVDGEKLSDALAYASAKFNGSSNGGQPLLFMPNLDVSPREHQVKMLEDLQTQRTVFGRHKNLVVAATGTGKTVLAALDYKAMQLELGYKPSLLFVAHRQEILNQSISTFRAVLKDGNFGELFVGGKKPTEWRHVFASVQSLSANDVSSFDPSQFDYVVIDEFHHAAAKTYTDILEHLEPKELLALTATPERGDGKRVQDLFFDGIISSELRLWDALDRQLLAPFDYFGIAEETDFTSIDWSNGKYSAKGLEEKVTRNDLRDRLVLNQIQKHVYEPASMKALVFCVGLEHANYIGELLANHGLKSLVLTGSSNDAERSAGILELAAGRINAIVTVDIFNEGVDIPEVDTVIMLRPTESSVVFLQQLGRGLRKSPGKESVTVLDFIGAHRTEFRMDKKFEALTGLLPGQLKAQIEQGFPNLPGGMSINLDSVAADRVLENIKAQLNYSTQRLVSLATKSGSQSLAQFLSDSGLELDSLYDRMSWFELRAQSGLVDQEEATPAAISLSKKSSRFLHIDDQVRIRGYSAIISGQMANLSISTDEKEALQAMLFWSLWPDAKLPSGKVATSYDEGFRELTSYPLVVEEMLEVLAIVSKRALAPVVNIGFKNSDLPILAHASYLRDELLGAVGWAYLESPDGTTRKSKGHQVGVEYLKDLDLDLFFVNLNKDEKKFTETTRYKDFALSKEVFNWQSQNKDSEESTAGQRYINQLTSKHDVLFCVREKSDGGAFKVLGLADYLSHKGSKPLEIQWQLRIPLDVETFDLAAAFKVS
jgi:superfamily II DNA or RNA helicase/HKD family nuclease